MEIELPNGRAQVARRVRELDPILVDVALAAGLGLPSAAFLGRVQGPGVLPLVAVMTVPLVWRRRRPVAAYAVQAGGLLLAGTLMPPVAQFVVCFLAVLAGAYATGRYGGRWPLALAVVAASMVPDAALAIEHGVPANMLWFLQLLFAWLIGLSVRTEMRRLGQHVELKAGAEPASSRPTPELSVLTRRELEVLRLLACGHSNSELAGLLHIGEGTVKTHVARILAKLGLRDRLQAVVLAYETGLVEPRSERSASRETPPAAGRA
jgi:DNA-binding CsgD family transcriptional regulator